ncbi:MAG: diheme cytochrome c [Gammaproteobacteria bacterium]|nr:diheme cytochrome c [Gammaproteobacteria bacterium]
MSPARALALFALSGLVSLPAAADGHRYPVDNPAYRSECGSCHVPYPPALLPASSWDAVLAGLQDHFGTDATLEHAAAREIADFLRRNAGREPRTPAPQPMLRITGQRWFAREHDEIAPRVWNRPAVKSRANCGACHTGAEQGRYGEGELVVPK